MAGTRASWAARVVPLLMALLVTVTSVPSAAQGDPPAPDSGTPEPGAGEDEKSNKTSGLGGDAANPPPTTVADPPPDRTGAAPASGATGEGPGDPVPRGEPAGTGEATGGNEDEATLRELERALAGDQAEAAEQRRGAETAGNSAAQASDTGSGGVVQGLVRTFQSLNPDISLIADVALAYFSDDEPLMVGGHDPTDNGFHLQQLELAVSAAVDPYFRFDANLVFSLFGVEIEEVYATTLSLPWNLQVRVGQFLTRFGRINATHPHTWAFVDQSLVIGKFFGGEGNRGLGVEASVLTPLPWYVEVVGSVTDASGASTARSFFGGEDLGVKTPLDFQYTAAIKQFFPLSDNWSLAWGLSYATGPNPTGRDNRTDIYGTDLYLKYRPITHGSYTVLSLDLEWLVRRRQVPGNVQMDHGMYAYLLWKFAKRWAVAGRYELVSGVDQNDALDPTWTHTRHRWSANLTFWPTEFSRLRAQYAYDLPGWRDAGYHAAFLAMEFAVGAHGAHKF